MQSLVLACPDSAISILHCFSAAWLKSNPVKDGLARRRQYPVSFDNCHARLNPFSSWAAPRTTACTECLTIMMEQSKLWRTLRLPHTSAETCLGR